MFEVKGVNVNSVVVEVELLEIVVSRFDCVKPYFKVALAGSDEVQDTSALEMVVDTTGALIERLC